MASTVIRFLSALVAVTLSLALHGCAVTAPLTVERAQTPEPAPAPQTARTPPEAPSTLGAPQSEQGAEGVREAWAFADLARSDIGRPDFWGGLREDVDLSAGDFRRYYSWPGLALIAGGVAAAAPLANTRADQDVRDWLQGRGREPALDGTAKAVNYAGQLWVIAPVCLELAALSGHGPEDYRNDGGVFEWSHRSVRAVAVGYPAVVSLYGLLGASRPDRGDSHWHPFRDFHGASGHTFLGAVPFLTAAAMTDDPVLQAPLVAGSMLMGWSRVHEDRHYLSQVVLGWWMAYLAVRTLDQNQEDYGPVRFVPTFVGGGPGVALRMRY